MGEDGIRMDSDETIQKISQVLSRHGLRMFVSSPVSFGRYLYLPHKNNLQGKQNHLTTLISSKSGQFTLDHLHEAT